MGKNSDSELKEVNQECTEIDISHLTGIEYIDNYIMSEVMSKPYLDLQKNSLAFSNMVSKIGRKFKVDTNSIDSMNERFYAYIDMCTACNKLPTEVEFSMFLGVHRGTLWDWSKGNLRSSNPGYADMVKNWTRFFENILTERAYFANNPAGAIFLLKNNHGYTDKQEISIEPKNPIGDTMSIEEIKASLPDHNNK